MPKTLIALALLFLAAAAQAQVARFDVTGPPTVIRNESFDVTVSAVKNDGSPEPAFTGEIELTLDPAPFGSENPPTTTLRYTFTPADQGVHTFTLTPTRGGYHHVFVTLVSTPRISGLHLIEVVCPDLTVEATNGGPICPYGEATTVSATSNAGPGAIYWWDSRFQTWTGQSRLVSESGTYTVTVTAQNGCFASDSTFVAKKSVPAPELIGTYSLCGDEHGTATVTNASAYESFKWFIKGGTIVSGQGTPTVTVMRDGTDSRIVLDVGLIDAPGGCATGGSWVIRTGKGVSAEITTPTAVCRDSTATASVPDAGYGTQYQWSITNGTLLTPAVYPSVQYKPTGNGDTVLHVYVVGAQDNFWCNATGSATVTTIGPRAEVDGTFTACPNELVTIPVTLAGTAPFRIVWSDGLVQDNITTSSASRTVVASEYTTYFVTQVRDANCEGSATGNATVEVRESPRITSVIVGDGNSVPRGTRVQIALGVEASHPQINWYEGVAGDRSKYAGSGATFLTPPLQHTTHYWAEVISACGTTATDTITVRVGGSKTRAVRH